jgi:hypothetical protein
MASTWVLVLALLGYCFADTGLQWLENRALPIFPPVGQSIDCADITPLSKEEQGLLVTLQGIVNRKQPRVYLSWNRSVDNDIDATNEQWRRGISERVTFIDHSSAPFDILEKYRSETRGAVVYDTVVNDTINLANTLAGTNDAVMATAQLAEQHKLAVVEDLRGRFKNKFDVYEYGLANVYSKTTKRL